MERLTMAAEAFRRHGFTAFTFGTAADVEKWVLAFIPDGDEVGVGGSQTVKQMGLADRLREKGCAVHWHWERSHQEWPVVHAAALASQYYICSANAVTEDGKLLLTDGAGNRLAGVISGPARVIVIAGKNKLVGDSAAARNRVREVAGPLNLAAVRKRIIEGGGTPGDPPPCVVTGRCNNCDSPQRGCSATLILERPTYGREVFVLLVNEELGL